MSNVLPLFSVHSVYRLSWSGPIVMPQIDARSKDSKNISTSLRSNRTMSYENFTYFLCSTTSEYGNNIADVIQFSMSLRHLRHTDDIPWAVN